VSVANELFLSFISSVGISCHSMAVTAQRTTPAGIKNLTYVLTPPLE
jgi:hypothetical protein